MTLAALAALALPCAALAATQGAIPVGTAGVTGTLPAGGAPQTQTVQLAAGQDYALAAVTPDDYQGSVIVQIDAAGADFAVGGCSFRAPYAGLYTVVVSDYNPDLAASYWLGVTVDCRADARTRCHLAAGHTHTLRFEYDTDRDWIAVGLKAGQRYRVAAQAAYQFSLDLALRTPDGTVLRSIEVANAPAFTFRAPRSGTYHIDTNNESEDYAMAYTVSLSLAR